MYVPAEISRGMSIPYGANPDGLPSTCRLETVSASCTACLPRRFHIPDIPQICGGLERLVEAHHTMIRLLDRQKRGSSVLQNWISNHDSQGLLASVPRQNNALYARIEAGTGSNETADSSKIPRQMMKFIENHGCFGPTCLTNFRSSRT